MAEYQRIACDVESNLEAVLELEFVEDVPYMFFYRRLADLERRRDFFVGPSICDEFRDLGLPIQSEGDPPSPRRASACRMIADAVPDWYQALPEATVRIARNNSSGAALPRIVPVAPSKTASWRQSVPDAQSSPCSREAFCRSGEG